MLVWILASHFYIQEPVVTMREFPSHNSKVVSQTTLGESIQLIQQEYGWSLITTSDNYQGFVPSESIVERATPYLSNTKITSVQAHIYSTNDTEYGPLFTLSYGTALQKVEEMNDRWIKIELPNGLKGYIQQGNLLEHKLMIFKEDLIPFSFRFLGLPYTWGGRSSLGYDCSGFIQMLYSHLNIHLPRDAKHQVQDPRFHDITADRLEPGDLIFFGKNPETICHVGLYIGQNSFIHATVQENQPWIHISSLLDSIWSDIWDYRTFRQLTKR